MPRKIYISPDSDAVGLQGFFPHATELEHDNVARHMVIGDKTLFEGCGYATHDEASLIQLIARKNRGLWLEIGAHTGWTTANIAYPGNKVMSVEPEFKKAMYNKTGDAINFFSRFIENVGGAIGIEQITIESPHQIEQDLGEKFNLRHVYPLGEMSWDCLPRYAERLNGRVVGAFIDGEHCPPFPLVDSMLTAPFLAESACVIYHDAIGSPVVAGVHWMAEWMQRNGRKNVTVRRYMTPQFLTVVACGDIELPAHQPDPTVDWFSYSQQIDREVEASLNKDFETWRAYAKGWARSPLDSW